MAVFGQNWEENNCFRHQNISAPLDGMYGSKAADETLLEVSSKIGEAKSKKELEFFQRHGFNCDPELGGPHYIQRQYLKVHGNMYKADPNIFSS